MSICNILDLGCFDKCNDVVISLINSETVILNTRTGINFTASSPNLGLLNPGVYCFTRFGQKYQFIVKDTADCDTYTPPLPPEGVYLDIAAYRFGDQFIEPAVSGTVPRTLVSSLGDNSGLLYDRGSSVLAIRSGNAVPPTIETFSTLSAAWDFSDAGKGAFVYDYLTGDLNPFKFLHGDEDSFTIFTTAAFPVGSDGNNITIMSTNNVGNSLSIGFTLRKSSANVIQVFSQRGTAGVSKFIATHSVSINDGDIAKIALTIDGVGVGAGALTVNGVTETFDVLNGTTANASPDPGLVIGGATANNGEGLYIQDVKILSTVASPAEVSAYMSSNPSIDTDPFPEVAKLRYNAENSAFVLNSSDLPASDGEEVQSLLNQIPNLLDSISWRFRNTSAGQRPTFQEAIQNGENALEYDGSNDELIADRSIIPEKGGNWALFVCALNLDSLDGSHVMSGDQYIAFTGDDYVGAFSDPYGVAHFSANTPTVIGTDVNNNVEAYCIKRVGAEVRMFNAVEGGDLETGQTLSFDMDNIGRPEAGGSFVNWWMDGYVFHIELVKGIVDDADCINYAKTLRDKYRG